MRKHTITFALITALLLIPASVWAVFNEPQMSDYQAFPIFAAASPPPLMMLVMGRNHKLFYEAYNDASDLDEDGKIDVGYKPDDIDYYGYFDSFKSYRYDSGTGQFNPVAVISDKKVAHGSGLWSGDFLNYLTMSRMDSIRKVLYGGYRVIDTASETVLERAYVPGDAHSWGKEYQSVARDGYDIRDYAPLDLPVSTPVQTRHLFASTSLSDTLTAGYRPLLRVLNDSQYRIWEWVSIERPVARDKCLNGSTGPNCAVSGGTTWLTVPGSTTLGISNVTQTFYDTTGYTYPADHAAYDTYVTTYAIPANLQGSRSVTTINGSGNPFDGDGDYYLSIFDGTLNVSADGTYNFSVDGDDAVELLIDINDDGDFDDAGEVVAGWYGGHGSCGCNTYRGSATLTAGSHTFQFRHQEASGGDNYYLRWEMVTAASSITDYRVRVKVAVPGLLETNYKQYPDGNYKPIGLLQRRGENLKMYFGLLTGSYSHSMSGGVLRKNVGPITDEIDPNNGVFTALHGIVYTINHFRISEFRYPTSSTSRNYEYDGGWVTTRAMAEGEFPDWGNPIGEMMYETLRYFAGLSPTSEFSSGTMADDTALGLSSVAWKNPYDPATGYPSCSKPLMLVISDINPTFDSDQLPGSAFGSVSSNLSGLNVSSLADTIGSEEGVSGNYYIGQQGATANSSCSSKTLNGLGDVRGLCPEEPTKQGSYYSASVAYHGQENDISAADGDQKVKSYMVGMASPLPRIEIQVGNKMMTLVPFAKSVGGSSISTATTAFQPTNTIVDFYVDSLDPDNPTYGKFRINYEDVEQGADHDMDAIVEYTFQVYQSDGVTPAVTAADGTNNGTMVKISLDSTYAAGGIIQHMGYIISGSSADGTYLEVRDYDTASASDPNYYLDTPNVVGALPLNTSRIFYPGTNTAASLLKDPFWYAAKWGNFVDSNSNGIPDQQAEWDLDLNGVPDAYYYVTNPLKLEEQLNNAFNDSSKVSSAGTAASVLATNTEGAGNTVQAYFLPSAVSADQTVETTWRGYIATLWVDPWGNLREDTNNNLQLDLKNSSDSNGASGIDRIVEFHTGNDSHTVAWLYHTHYLYNPANGDNFTCQISDCSKGYDVIELSDVNMLFESGKQLATYHPTDNPLGRDLNSNPREIFTYVGPMDAPASSADVIEFSTANASDLKPFLGLSDLNGTHQWDNFGSTAAARVDNLINYVHGTDISGMRNRTLDGITWRLGDIVHSTPIVVGRPAERFQQLYNDSEYADFLATYRNRETMIYVGANDGMLHAFTNWIHQQDSSGNPMYVSPGGPEKIGDELWAYIPQALLPHLKLQALLNYSHTYYVDGESRVFDASILPVGTHHSGRFGTFLIAGFGLGGKPMTVKEDFGSGVEERTFKPTYVLLDITDPRSPKLMWERTYDRMGFSHSVPAPVRVDGNWFLVFGSGPAEYDGTSPYGGYIYVVDMKTGDPIGSGVGTDWLWGGSDTDGDGIADGVGGRSNGYFTDPLALDIFQTANADAIYLSQNYYDTANSRWQADVHKIIVPCSQCSWEGYSDANVKYNGSPSNWTLGTFFESERPISVKLNSAVDPLNNVYLYFGTGRYLTDADKTDPDQQFLYGIKDPFYNLEKHGPSKDKYYHDFGAPKTLKQADLYDSDNVLVTTGGYVTGLPSGTDQEFSRFVQDMRLNEDGWRLSLIDNSPGASERVITRSAILGGIVLTPTFTPTSDVCEMGGTTSLIGVYYETGTGYTSQIFDIDTIRQVSITADNSDGTSTTSNQDVVEIRDDRLIRGTPAPKVVFHVGLEGGATSKLQMSNRSEGGGSTSAPIYFRSTITEWWDRNNE